jgi:DeoR/GlpR family transcriptional regulator of sugar metabolism
MVGEADDTMDARRHQILDYIASKGFATPEELARQHSVAAITVRRDLVWLEKAGHLKRVHGGAIPCDSPLSVTHVNARLRAATEEKRAIARAAADQVRAGEHLFLDAGSTCRFLAEALPDNQDLTVITHSLDNASVLAHRPGFRLILLGGEFNPRLNAFVSPMTETELSAFHADKAFLGAVGMDADGVTSNSLSEERIKAVMAQQAHATFVLADSSKLGKAAFRVVVPLSRGSCVITDAAGPAPFCAALHRKGVKVVKAVGTRPSTGGS